MKSIMEKTQENFFYAGSLTLLAVISIVVSGFALRATYITDLGFILPMSIATAIGITILCCNRVVKNRWQEEVDSTAEVSTEAIRMPLTTASDSRFSEDVTFVKETLGRQKNYDGSPETMQDFRFKLIFAEKLIAEVMLAEEIFQEEGLNIIIKAREGHSAEALCFSWQELVRKIGSFQTLKAELASTVNKIRKLEEILS